MSLTGPQHAQLQSALLAAFDEAGLRILVRQELDTDLDAVAGGKNKTEVVLNLIAWAEREGRVDELIAGAVKQNSTNPDLQALAAEAKNWRLDKAEPGASPYQGLAFFDVKDAGRFFGREALTQDLLAYLKDHRFLAVVGASGSGKSSVVRAGVVTAIRKGEAIKGSDKWAMFIVTPTAKPLDSLAVALTKDSESVTAAATLADDMAKHARSLGLYARRMTTGAGAVPRIVLVIDQFEELFTLCKDKAERKAFVDNLLAAATPDGVTTVILTLRADFYAHCAEFDNLRTALSSDQQLHRGHVARRAARRHREPGSAGRLGSGAGSRGPHARRRGRRTRRAALALLRAPGDLGEAQWTDADLRRLSGSGRRARRDCQESR